MQRTQFETLLKRSPLLAGVDPVAREQLSARFLAHPFQAGEPILRAGDPGRHLGVLLEGSALVQARRDDRAYTVELLETGRVFGEMAFFDPQSPRTADVVGTMAGVAALLPWSVYEELVRAGDPAAEVLERAVLDILSRRLASTNERLGELLEATRQGTFMSTLRRILGVRG
jgi:CRP-like cAMP-binding protein